MTSDELTGLWPLPRRGAGGTGAVRVPGLMGQAGLALHDPATSDGYVRILTGGGAQPTRRE